MSLGTPSQPYRLDAEAWGKLCLEIIRQRKPKIWRGVYASPEVQDLYIEWAARWAFHWAAKVSA